MLFEQSTGLEVDVFGYRRKGFEILGLRLLQCPEDKLEGPQMLSYLTLTDN